MTFIADLKEKWYQRQQNNADKIREKNDTLRQEGKEPLNKVNHLIDTGTSKLTQNSIDRQRSMNDLTGEHLETDNLRDEERQQFTEQLDKIRRYKQEADP